MFAICVEAIIYLLLHILHDCTFSILVFTVFYTATCCGRLYIFNANEIYLDKLTYLLTYLLFFRIKFG